MNDQIYAKVETMQITLDSKTKARLSVVAAIQNTSPEEVATELLRQASKYHAERVEDQQRLDSMRKTGGVPHNEMMGWLDDLASGQNV